MLLGKKQTMAETIDVEMVGGRISRLKVCGPIPRHKGQRAVVVTNGDGCFAARLTPRGWLVITEPVTLYPVLEPARFVAYGPMDDTA